MEECLGMDYNEASYLQAQLQNRGANKARVAKVLKRMMRGLFPELQEYCSDLVDPGAKNRAFILERLARERRGSVIATNPPLACGFAADQVLLYLLKNSPLQRNIIEIPEMPGYLYLDVAKMKTKVVKGKR